MKKNVYFIIAGLATLGILVGVTFFISSQPKKEATSVNSEVASEQPYKIFNQSVNDIVSVNVKNDSGEFTIAVTYEQGEPVYTMENIPADKQVSQSIVSTFMTDLINLIPAQIVEDNHTDLEKYGLTKPSFFIKATFKDGSSKTLKLGNDAPLDLGRYLQIDEGPTTYLLSSVNTEIFTNSKDAYLENKK